MDCAIVVHKNNIVALCLLVILRLSVIELCDVLLWNGYLIISMQVTIYYKSTMSCKEPVASTQPYMHDS